MLQNGAQTSPVVELPGECRSHFARDPRSHRPQSVRQTASQTFNSIFCLNRFRSSAPEPQRVVPLRRRPAPSRPQQHVAHDYSHTTARTSNAVPQEPALIGTALGGTLLEPSCSVPSEASSVHCGALDREGTRASGSTLSLAEPGGHLPRLIQRLKALGLLSGGRTVCPSNGLEVIEHDETLGRG